MQVGVQQSIGWVHYMFHTPEPQVLREHLKLDFNLSHDEAIIIK